MAGESTPAAAPAAPVREARAFEGPALSAALQLMDATADLAHGRYADALRKIERARVTTRRALGHTSDGLRFVDAAAWGESLAALRACSEAFAGLQVGQVPGRPDDILALTARVRAALEKGEAA